MWGLVQELGYGAVFLETLGSSKTTGPAASVGSSYRSLAPNPAPFLQSRWPGHPQVQFVFLAHLVYFSWIMKFLYLYPRLSACVVTGPHELPDVLGEHMPLCSEAFL